MTTTNLNLNTGRTINYAASRLAREFDLTGFAPYRLLNRNDAFVANHMNAVAAAAPGNDDITDVLYVHLVRFGPNGAPTGGSEYRPLVRFDVIPDGDYPIYAVDRTHRKPSFRRIYAPGDGIDVEPNTLRITNPDRHATDRYYGAAPVTETETETETPAPVTETPETPETVTETPETPETPAPAKKRARKPRGKKTAG